MFRKSNEGQSMVAEVQRVDKFLCERGMPDRIIILSNRILTAYQTALEIGVSESEIAKSLVVLVDNQPMILIIPGDKRANFQKLRLLINAVQIQLAPADVVAHVTGFDVNGVSPVAHTQSLPIIIDRSLASHPVLYAAAGSDHAIFRTNYPELITLTNGRQIEMTSEKYNRYYWVDEQSREIGVKFQAAEIYGVEVRDEDAALEESKLAALKIVSELDVEKHPILQGYRDLFKSIGVKKMVSSPEALLSFVARRHKFPRINTVVDAYNEKSAELCIVASAHDLARVEGDVRIVLATGNEVFYPVGSAAQAETIPAGEWIGMADNHVLCRLNCKQSELSKVTSETTDLLVYVQGNRVTSEAELREFLIKICNNIIKFNGGKYNILSER